MFIWGYWKVAALRGVSPIGTVLPHIACIMAIIAIPTALNYILMTF